MVRSLDGLWWNTPQAGLADRAFKMRDMAMAEKTGLDFHCIQDNNTGDIYVNCQGVSASSSGPDSIFFLRNFYSGYMHVSVTKPEPGKWHYGSIYWSGGWVYTPTATVSLVTVDEPPLASKYRKVTGTRFYSIHGSN